MQSWQTTNRTTVLRIGDGRRLTIETHTVKLPDGQVIDDWSFVQTPDYVNVVAMTTDGRFPIFRQTKYAVEGTTLATVGGYLEAGEEPLAAAQRELLEETGYVATKWTALGRYVVDGNRGCGHANLYLAHNATWQQPIDADDLEEQELLLLTYAELQQALEAGEFKVLAWATVVALALLKLEKPTADDCSTRDRQRSE